MITEFKLFESININIDIPQDVLNNLINTLSFITYKGSKRDEQKHKNFKSVRIKSIDGYYNNNRLNSMQLTTDCLFSIEMSNKDKIEAKYTKSSNLNEMLENSIYIEINSKLIFHLDNEKYDINSFIDMIGVQYKKYIENKKWKLK